jgi:hypothetical protein
MYKPDLALPAAWLLAFLGAVVPAGAGTEVCGTLKLPTEWTAGESPILITGNVFVPATSQLRIGPGVEVRFARRPKACPTPDTLPQGWDHADSALTGLTALGGFYCLGTPDRPVIFRPEDSGAAPGWEGIRLSGQAPGTVEIAFAEFHGANRAVKVENTAFTMHHVLFQDGNVGLWLGRRGDLTVLHCDFVRNRGAGIRVEGAEPRIVNNLFYRNPAYGIWMGSGAAAAAAAISYNAFFASGEEDCFHCPYSVLRPAGKNANGDSTDAFFNLRADPVFEGSDSYKVALATDVNQDTPPHLVKDAKLANLEKKSRLLFWKHSPAEPPPFSPRGQGPYVLSRYSKLIRAGHPSKALRNPDGTVSDIGLHGGPEGRLPGNPL